MLQIGDILKKVPFFQDLSHESIDHITDKLQFKGFQKNEIMCAVGDPGDRMYIILSGKVNILAGEHGSGNEEILAQLGPGNYFGEMALLTGEPRSATVVAANECETFVLKQVDFNDILDRYPSISLTMSRIMSQRLRDTIRKRAKRPKQASLGPTGPTGNLKDRGLPEIIRFCESNSLTGTVEVRNDSDIATFEYEKGELIKVRLSGLEDDKALDEILLWEDGEFNIKPKILSFEEKENAQQIVVARPKTGESKKERTICVVNSSIVVRKLIERNFVPLGYNVLTATDLTGILSAVRNTKPNIIISDIKFPEMTGIELCKQLREEWDMEGVPFIFLTDVETASEFVKQAEQLPQIYFSKAHDMAGLLESVKAILKS